jgi:UDP:flavonoid glycosyltransferase YjiC (YdhE family)
VDAVKLTDSRAIIQTKLEHLSGIPDPSSIFPIEYASHASVFPYCSAVVHHGGAGTTHSACRSGCPSIVVEHFLDQRFWGILLRRAGLSIGLLHRRSLTAEKLARKIRQVLASKKMAAEAQDTASAMIKEDGVGRAVELIERQLMRSDNI